MGVRLAACGITLIQDVLRVRALPEVSGEADVLTHSISIAGTAVDVAVSCLVVGTPVLLVTRVGEDAAGMQALQRLRKSGLEVACEQAGDTAHAWVMEDDDGQRQILTLGGAHAFPFEMALAAPAEVLALTGYDAIAQPAPMTDFAARARASGKRLYLDPGDALERLPGAYWRALCAHCDLLSLNEREASILTEIFGLRLEDLGCEVHVRLGEHGSRVFDGSSWFHADAHSVTAVDRTGAGDAYMAGCLLQSEGTARDRALLGNQLGARQVAVLGSGLPWVDA